LTASPNDTISSVSTQSEIGKEIVSNTYHTKDHWMAVSMHNDQKLWKCDYCQLKTYSINISRIHLKEHTLSCSFSSICKTHGDVFKQITKEEMDKSIVDLVVRTGISFSIFDNPLFYKMTRNLHYVINSYKVPHSTTISRHLTSDMFNKRFEFIRNILAKTFGQISLTCDGWHSTVHKCQTAEKILLVIKDTLEKYSIENKIFALIIDNTTTNKAVTRLFQNKLPNKELISI
ncbi:12223_t:CDS:2, partial [Cetraspora pellucida]